MENIKTVFIDRDGVLNRKSWRARYVRNWSEFEWMPDAITAVARLKKAGLKIILISNQAGVGSGQMTSADLADIEKHMQEDLRASGGAIDAAYYCLHRAEEECPCRKPKPGLLLQAQEELGLNFSESFFIGDDPKDLAAGRAVGCPTYLIDATVSLIDVVNREILREKVPS